MNNNLSGSISNNLNASSVSNNVITIPKKEEDLLRGSYITDRGTRVTRVSNLTNIDNYIDNFDLDNDYEINVLNMVGDYSKD